MIYKLVNSQKIIGRIMEDYVVDYSDFISRVPNWIYQAMRKLHITTGYHDEIVEDTVDDYKCALPQQTKILVGVSYQGYRLPRLNVLNQKVTDDMPKLKHPSESYSLSITGEDDQGNKLGDGYIVTTFREGTIKFYIKSFPLVKDPDSNLWFPLIPDIEEVYDALVQYVLMKILTRGHKLGDLSLKENNPFLNPGIGWRESIKAARNAAYKMDTDGREEISKLIRTFLVDYNFYTMGNFNPTENTDELQTGTYS